MKHIHFICPILMAPLFVSCEDRNATRHDAPEEPVVVAVAAPPPAPAPPVVEQEVRAPEPVRARYCFVDMEEVFDSYGSKDRLQERINSRAAELNKGLHEAAAANEKRGAAIKALQEEMKGLVGKLPKDKSIEPTLVAKKSEIVKLADE
ncbi:MAG: hypothetical protein KF712_17310 [Akkermansiaceae bacterium]|nr:hypothetical protein [Akkermansiaceae bacterium]